MARRLTQEEFIESCKKVHGDKYDYSKTIYKNKREKVIITCPIHGDFEQIANNHKRGEGCSICGNEYAKTHRKYNYGGFKSLSKQRFNDEYEFPNIKEEYENSHSKITIKHKVCGRIFKKIAGDHLTSKNGGCPCFRTIEIKKEKIKIDKNIVSKIEKSLKFDIMFKEINEKINNQFSYDKSEYVNNSTPITFHCNKCNRNFKRKPTVFINSNHNCAYCSTEKRNIRYTTEEWITKAKEIHGDKYDYSKVEYNKTDDKVCVICHKKDEFGEEHGEFWVTPHSHTGLLKTGCPKCSNKYSDKERFIKLANKKYNNYYDYSKVEYVNATTDVIIICPKHGEFKTTPNRHLNNSTCPLCNESSLEHTIRLLLEENNIRYEFQKTFEWLKYESHMFLDFYLTDYSIAIECQGEQHFKPIDFFGGEDELKIIKERDRIKRQLCEENNIKLLYYTETNLENFSENINSKEILLEKILGK